MRFGTWNVRNLYRAGSLTAATRELAWLEDVFWSHEYSEMMLDSQYGSPVITDSSAPIGGHEDRVCGKWECCFLGTYILL